ncbi:MAG: N-acetylmuramoyl-L-alanine amidase [Rivularia sp. (in: cyanobacteria)]
MKIAIDRGHGARFDGGAVGIRREEDLIGAVADCLVKRLRNAGQQIIETRPLWASSTINSLSRRCQTANNANADIFVSLHFNAFNGQAHGTEVYAISSKGKAIAQKVVNNIASLGYFNRGVKHQGFYVLRYTSMPAILVEGCFIDSQRDINLFDADKIARAIATGLLQ